MTKRLIPETDYGIFRCGSRNRNAKLTTAKVKAIKVLLKERNSQKSIAKFFGVHPNTISKINTGRTWRWVK
jgi:hypothetical protein